MLIFIIDEILESGSKMRNARTVIAGVLCALMICCMLGNAYTVKGKEMLLAPENKEKKKNTEMANKIGVIEATNNLLTSNLLNLFVIQSIGTIIYTIIR